MAGQYKIITGHPPDLHAAAARRRLTWGRARFILVGAVIGLTWAASLRGFMAALAGPASTFTFSGTFGIIIPTGIIVGALLGWAEHQRRTGIQHPVLILAPLLLGIIPNLAAGPDAGPVELALLGMAGGFSVSGRGPVWARTVAGLLGLASIAVTFLAPKPVPDLSYATAHGAWFCTLASSLFVTFALACSIPMRRPETSHRPSARSFPAGSSGHRPAPSASVAGELPVADSPTQKEMP